MCLLQYMHSVLNPRTVIPVLKSLGISSFILTMDALSRLSGARTALTPAYTQGLRFSQCVSCIACIRTTLFATQPFLPFLNLHRQALRTPERKEAFLATSLHTPRAYYSRNKLRATAQKHENRNGTKILQFSDVSPVF